MLGARKPAAARRKGDERAGEMEEVMARALGGVDHRIPVEGEGAG